MTDLVAYVGIGCALVFSLACLWRDLPGCSR